MASVRLIGSGDTTALGPLALDPADPHVLLAPVGGLLKPGAYRIAWRLAARDGHPVRGVVEFTVRDPAGVPAVSNQEPENPVDSIDAPYAERESFALGGAVGFILVRWLAFISIFAVIGAAAFKLFVLRQLGSAESGTFVHIASTNAATLGFTAAAGVAISSLLKLARESSDMPDIPIGSMLFGSTWGLVLLIQFVASLVAAAAFRVAHGESELARSNAWHVAGVAAVIIGITPALSGHAIAGDKSWLGVPADIVHVLVGATWLGTLAVIVVVGIAAALKAPDAIRPGERVASMINAFSPIALICGGAVVATGLGSSVMRLQRIDALWTTPYGVVLALKLIFVALLFAAGAWNWRRLKPRLTGDDAIAPMRSSASLELLLAAVVLGVTSVLVALELP